MFRNFFCERIIKICNYFGLKELDRITRTVER